eukprot:14175340-Alexandrium_andersonii.AAC.1
MPLIRGGVRRRSCVPPQHSPALHGTSWHPPAELGRAQCLSMSETDCHIRAFSERHRSAFESLCGPSQGIQG